jgi:hypothetical protein
MRRFEHWTQEYDRRRYLSNWDLPALNERLEDVVNNSLTLRGVPPKLSPHVDVPRMHLWGRRLCHVERELRLRGIKPRCDLSAIPLPTSTTAARAAVACAQWGMPPRRHVVKYGKIEHLGALFEQGRLLVRPASFYRKLELAAAVRDDELAFTRIVPADQLPAMSVRDAKTGRIKATGVVPESMNSISSVQDYYLFCVSSAWDPRLFVDFHADAALVLHPDALRRVDSAVRALKGPVEALPPVAVDYIDPVECQDGDCEPPFVKHFRYTYQSEVRIAWFPMGHPAVLEDFFVTMAPLRDLATLVRI